MIPLSTFNTLVVVVILLAIYSWIDHRNKLYGNIAAAIIASITSAILSILVYLGAVQTSAGTAVNDVPTAGFLILITVVTAVYAFFMVMEAKEEYESTQESL